MKKTAAFLTLIFSLAVLILVYYIHNYYPGWRELEPAVNLVKSFIAEQWHRPVLGGLAVAWLAAFVLSWSVLREPSCKIGSPVAAAEKNAAAELTAAREELVCLEKRFEESDRERSELKQSAADMQGQIQNLLQQLEKHSATENAVSEKEKNLNGNLNRLQGEMVQLQSELKAITAEKDRAVTEAEALAGKIEKIEQESKNARREAEKLGNQLKTAAAEQEKKNEEIAGLKQRIEALDQELKSALANARGGKEGIPPAAYQILYLFQKEGRLIDLLCEDISGLDDETLGGAIRPIHEGCRRLLEDRLILEHVLNEEEGSEVTVDEVDPEAIKLSGRVPSKGPYTGELIHRGWRLRECNLPELVDGWKGNVIAPAEIEIS
jgi:predicted  nucleic acid-binding Zn-ribbon protein